MFGPLGPENYGSSQNPVQKGRGPWPDRVILAASATLKIVLREKFCFVFDDGILYTKNIELGSIKESVCEVRGYMSLLFYLMPKAPSLSHIV